MDKASQFPILDTAYATSDVLQTLGHFKRDIPHFIGRVKGTRPERCCKEIVDSPLVTLVRYDRSTRQPAFGPLDLILVQIRKRRRVA